MKMSMESWWNDSIWGYRSAWEETCPGHILHHKSHIDLPRIEPGPPYIGTDD